MVQKSLRVELALKLNSIVANEVATSVSMRANPHQSMLTEQRLIDKGITPENLSKYFLEVGKAVAQFWNNQWDMTFQTVVKPHELRGLYLPLMYGVIFSSIGNCKSGNYEYVIKAQDDEIPDRKFLIDFSAKLEDVRDVLKGDVGQVGNRAAQPQTSVMMCLIGDIASDSRTAEMLIRDGVSVDKDLAGLSTLVGLSLVEEALTCMYTGVEEVNFRQLTDTLVDKGFMEMKKADTSESNSK